MTFHCQWKGEHARCDREATQRVVIVNLRTGETADDRVFCTVHLDNAAYCPTGYKHVITHV